MAGPRRFDHDEARRRYAAGESPAVMAREYGVSVSAVRRVVDERYWRWHDKHAAAWREAARTPCRGGCGRLTWTRGTTPRTGYCPTCLGERRRVVRHGTESEYSKGCRCEPCRLAASAARTERRLRSRVPCSHGCGTLVDAAVSRRTPGKPPECHPCAIARVQRSGPFQA